MTAESGTRIHISGIVQGVGFRPFIYSLATRLELTGWVRNTSSGVEIEVNGDRHSLEAFITAIRSEAPPLAKIDSIDSQPCEPDGFINFTIQESHPGSTADFIPISADVALCDDGPVLQWPAHFQHQPPGVEEEGRPARVGRGRDEDLPWLEPCPPGLADDPDHHHDVVDPRWAALQNLTKSGTEEKRN